MPHRPRPMPAAVPAARHDVCRPRRCNVRSQMAARHDVTAICRAIRPLQTKHGVSGRRVIARRDSAAAIPASGKTAGDCFAALAMTAETGGMDHNQAAHNQAGHKQAAHEQAALNQTLRVGG